MRLPKFRDEAEEKAFYNEPASVPSLSLAGWLSIAGGAILVILAFSDPRENAALVPAGIGGFLGGMVMLAFARVILELRAIRRALMEIRTIADRPYEEKSAAAPAD